MLPHIDVLVCNQREACSIAGVPYGGAGVGASAGSSGGGGNGASVSAGPGPGAGAGADAGVGAATDEAVRPTWAQIDEAVRRLQQAGAPLVVITLGSQGAIAVDRAQWWFQPTRPRPVVDTTGCGDAFAAGFLFGWCGSHDVRRGLVYGCACGAAAVGQVGGSSPIAVEEINACMRRNEGMMISKTAMAGVQDEREGGVASELQQLLARTAVPS